MKNDQEDVYAVLEITTQGTRGRLAEVRASQHMVLVQRTVYIAAVLACVSYVALYPTWVGRSHSGSPGHWNGGEAGVFGLEGALTPGFYGRAPVWSPPAPHGGGVNASVRWPWQPVSRQHHIEIAMARLLARCSAGIILLGFLLRIANWINPPSTPDLTDSIAWSLSLVLIIAWLAIGVLAVFSMGYAATDHVVTGVLSAGFVAGTLYGLYGYRVACIRQGSGLPAVHTSPIVDVADAAYEFSAHQPRLVGVDLFWFTFGIVVALCITWIAISIASPFRGPVVGVWELGTPRFAHDQKPINWATGCGILAAGWLLGGVFLRKLSTRGFAIGVLVASTLLGLLFAMRT